jgi:hypothetical protein
MLRCQPPSRSWFDRRRGLSGISHPPEPFPSNGWKGGASAPPQTRLSIYFPSRALRHPPYAKSGKTVYYAEPQLNYGGF